MYLETVSFWNHQSTPYYQKPHTRTSLNSYYDTPVTSTPSQSIYKTDERIAKLVYVIDFEYLLFKFLWRIFRTVSLVLCSKVQTLEKQGNQR